MNNIIKFDGHQVDILNRDGSRWDGQQEAWFIPKQIATAIGASDPAKYSSNLLSRNPEKFEGFKGSLKLRTPGGTQEVTAINENGLYMFLMASDLSKAIAFQRKVTDLLKQVRLGNVVPLSKDQALVTVLRTTADLMEGQEQIIQRIDEVERKVDEQITLHSGEQRKAQKEIVKRVYELAEQVAYKQLGFDGDEVIVPDLEKERRRLFSEIHRTIKDCFAVASYKDVRRSEFNQLLLFIQAWRPKLIA